MHLLIAIAMLAELGFTVRPPLGWTEDAEGSKALLARTKAAFFAASKVDVDATVLVDPEHPMARLAIQTFEMAADPKRDTLEELARHLDPQTQIDRRTAGDTRVLDFRRDSAAGQLRGTYQTVVVDGIEHAIAVQCEEPFGGTACDPVIASIGVGEEESGYNWWYWIAIAGALLVSIGLVGWRMEVRRQR